MPDVRFGSKADITERLRDVRFTPDGNLHRQRHRPRSSLASKFTKRVELIASFVRAPCR